MTTALLPLIAAVGVLALAICTGIWQVFER
jgi:hypothetical protein